jgi:hypothetical protein
MRGTLEANRSLFYSATLSVDHKERLEERIEKLRAEGKPWTELASELKQATRTANLLTPMTKYVLTESANRITYDALQIHGGTGYMKEFRVERLARDARITNIYEGTSQLQIVAASGQVVNDILGDYFDGQEKYEFPSALSGLAQRLKDIRDLFRESLAVVLEKKDGGFQDVAAKDLVELYSYLTIGYLLLHEAERDSRKIFIANRYILNAASRARSNAESIKSGVSADLLHADKILAI